MRVGPAPRLEEQGNEEEQRDRVERWLHLVFYCEAGPACLRWPQDFWISPYRMSVTTSHWHGAVGGWGGAGSVKDAGSQESKLSNAGRLVVVRYKWPGQKKRHNMKRTATHAPL